MADKKQRTYIVTNHKAKTVRLVKAPNQARALAHVIKDELSVDFAEQDDLIHLLGDGVKVEQSGDEPDPQSALPLEPTTPATVATPMVPFPTAEQRRAAVAELSQESMHGVEK
jgi:hypothetical protein